MTAKIFPKRNWDTKIKLNRKQKQNPIRIKARLCNFCWTSLTRLLEQNAYFYFCSCSDALPLFSSSSLCQPVQNAGLLRWLQRQVKTLYFVLMGSFQTYFHRFSKMLKCIIFRMNSEVILFWSVKICVNVFSMHCKNLQK